MPKRHAGASADPRRYTWARSKLGWREVIDLRIRLAGSQDTKLIVAVQDDQQKSMPGDRAGSRSGRLLGRGFVPRARGEPAGGRPHRPRPARPDLRSRLDLRRAAERGTRDPAEDDAAARGPGRRGRPSCSRHRRRPLPPRRGRARSRGAAVHPVRRLAEEPEPLALRHRRVLLPDPGGDGPRLPGQADAMRRTLEVAERCNVEIVRHDPPAEVPRARGPRRAFDLPRRAPARGRRYAGKSTPRARRPAPSSS